MPDLVQLLAAVEDRQPAESGAFVVDADGAIHGSVFVETSQVCWAATTGRRGRLRDLLRYHAEYDVDDTELDDTLAQCRDEHRGLGDLLIERGLISEDGLRAAIKQHTVESLIAQCDGPERPATWMPHRRRGYHARFTFPPTELLAAAGAELYPAESLGADTALSVALPMAQIAGSFAIGDDDEPVAVRTAGSSASSVRDLLELGDWAAAALAACSGFSPAVMARVVAEVTGPAALGWRSARRLLHVAIIDDPAALADVVAELSRRALPAVLSSRLPAQLSSYASPFPPPMPHSFPTT